MEQALNAVIHLGVSVSRAAADFGIPKSTLDDHCKGRVLPGSKCGPRTILTVDEEADLVSFLIKSSEIGYPYTRLQILALVEGMLVRKNKDKPRTCSVTHGWWASFRRRHPEISLKTSFSLSVARAKASSAESLSEYFSTLQETLEESELIDQPGLIYNMDETGFPLEPKPPKTVHRKGDKQPYHITKGSKSQVTVVACVNASGQYIPPMVIFARKTMNPELAVGEVPGTVYGMSAKGWMTSIIFDKWFKRHFLRYASAVRPIILLMDGHSSHYSPETIQLAAEEGVILFALPPNTTHLSQPLDKGVFGPFKVHWRQVCHDYRVSQPGRVVNIYSFNSLLSKAWMKSMTAVNIINGFKTTGIYPLNQDAVIKKLPGKSTSESSYDPDVSAVFTPLKREPRCKLMSTPVIFDDDTHTQIDSPLQGPEDNSVEQQPTMHDILTLRTPTFKVKNIHIKPDPHRFVLTRKECVQDAVKKQKLKEEKELKKLEKEQKKLDKMLANRRQDQKRPDSKASELVNISALRAVINMCVHCDFALICCYMYLF